MKKSDRKKTTPKRILRLPDLDYAKRSVLNSLGSPASKRAYEFGIDDFVAWYCSEPRLAFSRTVVLRYRIELESRRLAPSSINLRLAPVRRLAYEAAQPRPGGRHPAREGRQTSRRPPGELVDGRTGSGSAPSSRCSEVEGSPRPGDSGIDARLWPAAGRSGRPHNRSPPATRGALGYRRLGGQGCAHSDRSGARLGEVSRGCVGVVSASHERAAVPVR